MSVLSSSSGSGMMPASMEDAVRQELQTAEAAHMADGIGCLVRARIPLELLARAKNVTGLADTEQVLQAALVHLLMDRKDSPGH